MGRASKRGKESRNKKKGYMLIVDDPFLSADANSRAKAVETPEAKERRFRKKVLLRNSILRGLYK